MSPVKFASRASAAHTISVDDHDHLDLTRFGFQAVRRQHDNDRCIRIFNRLEGTGIEHCTGKTGGIAVACEHGVGHAEHARRSRLFKNEAVMRPDSNAPDVVLRESAFQQSLNVKQLSVRLVFVRHFSV